MRKLFLMMLLPFMMMLTNSAFALLSMELTQGVMGAIPIAVVPFNAETAPDNISAIINNDLRNSGRFKVIAQNNLSERPSDVSSVSSNYFHGLGTDNVVIGKVTPVGGGRYQISFQLLDLLKGKGAASIVISKKYTVGQNDLRGVAHHISDLIYQQLTGIPGVFSTKLAYIIMQHLDEKRLRYVLEVADQDGYNPRQLLNSPEPIMSPSWSPNGKKLAYVSFENKKASIYVQDVSTGARQVISSYPGINGAPAWSPDGRKLAVVLSKSGSPNIYVLDIYSGQLKQVTNDFYINTEPAWSPDGRSLLFTSNRGGGVQIYRVDLSSNDVSRITYTGDYNARASYTSDGNHVVMIHRAMGTYNIAILDLDTGTTRILSSTSTDNDSPSVAPNGSMILYDTYQGGRSALSMVSADGRVKLLLPSRGGEAQDPAWSPFL